MKGIGSMHVGEIRAKLTPYHESEKALNHKQKNVLCEKAVLFLIKIMSITSLPNPAILKEIYGT